MYRWFSLSGNEKVVLKEMGIKDICPIFGSAFFPSLYHFNFLIIQNNKVSYLVEDTVDVKQKGTDGQKNEDSDKNNRFVRPCSIVTSYPVSSTARRSHNK